MSTYLNKINVICLDLAIRVLGDQLASALEGIGPVDQIQIQVIGVEVFQRGVDSVLNILGPVAVVPQLRGDEDLRSRDATLLNAGGDSWLCAVDSRGVDVAVAGLDGFVDSIFLCIFVLPCTESNGS